MTIPSAPFREAGPVRSTERSKFLLPRVRQNSSNNNDAVPPTADQALRRSPTLPRFPKTLCTPSVFQRALVQFLRSQFFRYMPRPVRLIQPAFDQRATICLR